MPIATLNEHLAFSPQILPEHVAELARLGFEQLICNRPDDEEMGQPSIASIEAEAIKNGLSVVYAPVANSQFTLETITASQNALANGKKTLMFCRSGMRSSILWAIIQIRLGQSSADVLQQTASIGYDNRHMQVSIEAIANAEAN